jgi:ABC-type transport system involved in multi-copper enzyme maturation permease subunit
MTAATSTSRSEATQPTLSLGRLPGFGGLARKELKDWRRGRRTWVVLVISTLFMALTALNGWLQANVPAEAGAVPEDAILDPTMALVGAASSQIFVIAAVFAVMNLIVGERESGTLAWTASKPVSRTAIWLTKFSVSTLVLWVAAGIIPLAATVALVFALYGPVPIQLVGVMVVGILLATALFVAVTLAASTVVSSQAAVAAIGLAVMFLPQLLGLVIPAALMPTSILQWTLLAGVGESAGVATPIAWVLAMAALVAFSVWRMERLEL